MSTYNGFVFLCLHKLTNRYFKSYNFNFNFQYSKYQQIESYKQKAL